MQVIGLGTSSLVRALTARKLTDAGSGKEGRKRKRDNRECTKLDLDESEHLNSVGILFDVVKRGLQQCMALSGRPLKLLRISNCITGIRTKAYSLDLRTLRTTNQTFAILEKTLLSVTFLRYLTGLGALGGVG